MRPGLERGNRGTWRFRLFFGRLMEFRWPVAGENRTMREGVPGRTLRLPFASIPAAFRTACGAGERKTAGGASGTASRSPFPDGRQPRRIPATAPVMQVDRVPATMERKPRATMASRLSGAMAPNPPSMMPRLPGFAKPQRA